MITSSFSVREHPLFGYTKMHPAIDLAKNQGSPIYAIAAGTGYIDRQRCVNRIWLRTRDARPYDGYVRRRCL